MIKFRSTEKPEATLKMCQMAQTGGLQDTGEGSL